MPGQLLVQPNPPADPSHLPDSVLDCRVRAGTASDITSTELASLDKFKRAVNYIAAAMIFLKDNVLLERKLTSDDIKPRLLGHWGTCPGLTLVYAHLNRIIKKTDLDALLVIGPGHGAPGILSCLWLEEALACFWPRYSRDRAGLTRLIAKFSTPGGFPSHINAETPGCIHEGGELGYALSVSFGAVMDNPYLVAVCVVGDGEAETGPTATAWHGFKYIDPVESGAVLPILHLNGFKISERTIFGCMDDKELIALFSGYGYQVCIVDDLPNIDKDLAGAMEWALGEISRIQHAARSKKPIVKPRWPMLILRTPKGWSCPKVLHGEFIEGSFRSHQVPLPEAKTSEEELQMLQDWLASYRPEELFTVHSTQGETEGAPISDVTGIIPVAREKRLGFRKEAYVAFQPLSVPDWMPFGIESGREASCMKTVGSFLSEVIKRNSTTFRIFSPDELVSNKLDAVFDVTARNFQWDVTSRAREGALLKFSPNTPVRAFIGIVHTMMVQYSKFVKMAHETEWRHDIGSVNFLETSTWARQEHNGFSHQNPSFIGALLDLKPKLARVYLPPDANCFLSTVAHCLGAKNYINLMVGSKQSTTVWLSPEEANRHCKSGASVWKFASTEEGVNPDAVLVGIGTEVTFEVIAAAALLRKLVPALRVRVVNVTDLMILGPPGSHPHALSDENFDSLFTPDRPVIVNYHSYPVEVKGLLYGRPNIERISIRGYQEEGTTTSPFDMMLCNEVSRYDVAAAAIRAGEFHNPKVTTVAHEMASYVTHLAKMDKKYICHEGRDPDGTFDTPVFEKK
ncbi:putative phosphoketolase [Boletus reticuloceps]|uniref:Putative phosphoketolase n=1 Tax=Boletus reticuloceps TaxID=495285 RepID=A0A8I3A6F4_9AGAM|nr:putative phosphoketolase [Boletus reticuloceps]